MTEVARRVNFEHAALHQPEFMEMHKVLQAASQPSVENFRKALQHLSTGSKQPFTRLKDVATEQAAGNGESDLRRIKRQFGSLKNTFILYDVKQSFIEGLADGCPDGTEEGQIAEVEVEAEKFNTEVKQLKERNGQMQGELEELIDSLCTTYKDFSQKQAEIGAHLECIASEEAQRASHALEPLPDLTEGPDEAACQALLASEAQQTAKLDATLAACEAEEQELLAAIESEEEELAALRMQIQELEVDHSEEYTQEVALKFADAAAWCDEMCALVSTLSGVRLVSADNGWLHLELAISLPGVKDIETSMYQLKIAIEPLATKLGPVVLEPADVPVEDIVAVPHPQKLAFLVREIQARLVEHLWATARRMALEGAKDCYSLKEGASANEFTFRTPSGVAGTISVPQEWPATVEALQLKELISSAGIIATQEALVKFQAQANRSRMDLITFLEAAAQAALV